MIVLDTHVLIWMDADDAALGPQARARIEQAWRGGEVAVSAISFWECAMLVDKGRIALPLAVESWRAGLLGAGLVERMIGFVAGVALGAEGRPSLGAMGLDRLAEAPRFRLVETRAIGGDVMSLWEPQR